jgi:hypothetical protein
VAAPSTVLTVIKQFAYRGDTHEEFSNTYALTGATPADSGAWRTLFDALVAEEKKLYPAGTKVVAGYGYHRVPQTGDSADWSVDLTVAPNAVVPGTFAPGAGGFQLPGDSAVWVRWGLDRLNSKGKRVYLRKYFHPAFNDGTPANVDVVVAGQVTALAAFGAKLQDGTFAGARVLTDHLGTALIGHAVSTFVTTRTLKRRGKRPPT